MENYSNKTSKEPNTSTKTKARAKLRIYQFGVKHVKNEKSTGLDREQEPTRGLEVEKTPVNVGCGNWYSRKSKSKGPLEQNHNQGWNQQCSGPPDTLGTKGP